jgi:hypothetical protein
LRKQFNLPLVPDATAPKSEATDSVSKDSAAVRKDKTQLALLK